MTQSASQAFNELHEGIQRWIWKHGWTELRDIQEMAITHILGAQKDVVISAATATGKTEAAFFPSCSYIAKNPSPGFQIVYISPLKALINDQFRRLKSLCEVVSVPLTPWHGDIAPAVKRERFSNPKGILLITPESLESLFVNQAVRLMPAFSNLSFIIIDEFHAFIGTERGCQLHSLMHRLEYVIGKSVPRIALSATLGDMEGVAAYLRPNGNMPCEVIESNRSRQVLKLQLRGYIKKGEPEEPDTIEEISGHLFKELRGSSNLIFANSRANTERYACELREKCEHHGLPNEFFPHHGNLSKGVRENIEKRLQQGKLPTSAVCTVTLELGIDIGSVNSIAQVGVPHSVASLRQRLGRSGRKGESAVLRMYIEEKELTGRSHICDRLRVGLFQAVAVVNLLLKKWYEPPGKQRYHFSTLVQQVLSLLAQYGGIRADQVWKLLCDTGPFEKVTPDVFADFLRSLAKHDIITQTHDGLIVLGMKGERIVSHFNFYSAFFTPKEYRLETNGKALGTLPIHRPLSDKDYIIFAGKRWKVLKVDTKRKVVQLELSKGGRVPLFFGEGMMVHDEVRREMHKLYCNSSPRSYLDETAFNLWQDGLSGFNNLRLAENSIVEDESSIFIFPWLGDKALYTLTLFFQFYGLKAFVNSLCIEIRDSSIKEIKKTIQHVRETKMPAVHEITSLVNNKITDKYDYLLSTRLLEMDYSCKKLDFDSAWQWIQKEEI